MPEKKFGSTHAPAPTLLERNTSLSHLELRAAFLSKVRAHFHALGVLEVDCPALSFASSIDAHIDPMRVALGSGKSAYLHTSPEYAMKRLLALHRRDLFYLGHVFRDNEEGPLHLPEFTMIEWYRCNLLFEDFIEETLKFISLFVGRRPVTILTYQEAFEKHVQLNPFHAGIELLAPLANHPKAHTWDRDTLLQCLFSLHVEPKLQELTAIRDYPSSQAALAQIRGGVAERFEIYCKGIELANGFHELQDAKEQRRRLVLENKKRESYGKSPLPIDESFLKALERGLPDCCGVAAGFDRLMLFAHETSAKATCGQWGSGGRR